MHQQDLTMLLYDLGLDRQTYDLFVVESQRLAHDSVLCMHWEILRQLVWPTGEPSEPVISTDVAATLDELAERFIYNDRCDIAILLLEASQRIWSSFNGPMCSEVGSALFNQGRCKFLLREYRQGTHLCDSALVVYDKCNDGSLKTRKLVEDIRWLRGECREFGKPSGE